MPAPRCLLLCAALAIVTGCGPKQPSATATASQPGTSGSMPVATLQHTSSTDGVSIAWRRYGQGDTAVVLIHGWAVDSTIWAAQLAALSARYEVVTLDLAGQGASGANRSRWTVALFAHDIAAVAAQLASGHIILVGQGMGGPVALEAAPLIGTRLTGIVGVETFRTIGANPPLPSQLEHALQPFRTDFPGAIRQFVTGTLFPPKADPDTVHTVVELMTHAVPERAVAELAELNQFDYTPVLAAVKVPIVTIDSDRGGAVDEARVHHAAPQLRVISMKGADSFAMLDDAGHFNATLLQAVDSLARR